MKIPYKPEIDGLRAIAVLSVVIYHLQFQLNSTQILVGGFIGVDIFFVISGYLITTLILKEIYETNRFSFKNFYVRRIRRILPVLLFIMIITLIVGYFFLLPNPYSDLAKASISSVFFYGIYLKKNIKFISSYNKTVNTEYWNQDATRDYYKKK